MFTNKCCYVYVVQISRFTRPDFSFMSFVNFLTTIHRFCFIYFSQCNFPSLVYLTTFTCRSFRQVRPWLKSFITFSRSPGMTFPFSRLVHTLSRLCRLIRPSTFGARAYFSQSNSLSFVNLFTLRFVSTSHFDQLHHLHFLLCVFSSFFHLYVFIYSSYL